MRSSFLLILSLVAALGCATAFAAMCTVQDNTDFDGGFLVELLGVSNASACCEACSTFEECTAATYVKDPKAGQYYQRCYIKNYYQVGASKANAAITAVIPNPKPPAPATCATEKGVDYDNGWLSLLENVPSADVCCAACSNYPGCKAYTWTDDATAGDWNHRCFLKGSTEGRKVKAGANSGLVTGSSPALRTGKRGLSWFNTQSCSDLKLFSKISWIYNWAPMPDPYTAKCALELGIEFIPMAWNAAVINDLNFTVWSASNHIFGFNEPNFFSQANTNPTQAAQAWPKFQTIAQERKFKIGSPSAAACGPIAATDCYGASWWPLQWFDQFFKNCTNCQVDFVTTHIYTCNITEFTNYLDTIITTYKKPVWLTEFACPAAGQSIQVELTFMKAALAYLDSNPMIERYAWFGTRIAPTDNWLGPQVNVFAGTLSALSDVGKLYNTM